jgi:hypothetical protein
MDCGTDFFKKARDGILFGGGRLPTERGTGMEGHADGVRPAAWDFEGTAQGRVCVCVCLCVSVCVCMCVYMQWRSVAGFLVARRE